MRALDPGIEKIPVDKITPQTVARAINFHILADHLRVDRDGSIIPFQIGDILHYLGYGVPSDNFSPDTDEYATARKALNTLVQDGALNSRFRTPEEEPEDPERLVYWVGGNREQLKTAAEGRLSTPAHP